MSLAAKLPYSHPYANGFGYGGTNVPTDTDGLDYLSRMATADGTGLETGVAGAIDRFIKACKADNIWDSIRSSCILAGARSLNGALVPIKNEGPELVDINSLPTPSLTEAGGSSGAWDASTRKMLSNAVGTNTSHPRFLFPFAGMAAGKQYAISGRVSGDTSHVEFIRAGATGDLAAINKVTGEFSASLASSGTNGFMFLLNGTLAPTSVTIESLSIREVIDDPINSPVGNGFAGGDYSRTDGLTGDGTSYLDTGRANNADPQNDHHMAAYSTSTQVGGNISFAGAVDGTYAKTIYRTSANSWLLYDGRLTAPTSGVANASLVGLVGVTRTGSSAFSGRVAGVPAEKNEPSFSWGPLNIFVFGYNGSGTLTAPTSSRLAFYSIGTSLGTDPADGLADLDTAVTNLMADITFFFNTGLNPADYDTETVRYVNAGYAAGGTLE